MSWAMVEEIRQSEIKSLSIMEKKDSETVYRFTIEQGRNLRPPRKCLNDAKTTTVVFKILYLVEIPDRTLVAFNHAFGLGL